jgi:Zn-dependent peptidase ImmA (M78 family)
MSIETAASKVPVQPEKLAQWESGAAQPTIRQAEILANAYRRPLALFFLPQLPHDFMPLQDYRRKTAGPLTTASVFIIREIQQRQAWAREFCEENGESALPFVGRYSIRHSPTTVARDMLDELGIDPGKYRPGNPMKEWIEKAETKGIFISRTSFVHSRLTLDSEEFQGFAIADPIAPFVFINSDDWGTAQLFSLVHELAHIWINQSGISSEIVHEGSERDRQHPVELFCNHVAANCLLPEEIMNIMPENTFDLLSQVQTTARHYGVSSFVLLVRALELRMISHKHYRDLKKEAEKAYQDYIRQEEIRAIKQKEQESGPNPYLIRANRNGHLFTRFVIDAYRNGAIQPTEASNLLNTHVNHFSKLEAFVYS